MPKNNLSEFEDGEVQVWIEQESIHMLARDKNYGDPAEITTETARQIAKKLNQLADLIEAGDQAAAATKSNTEILASPE